MKNINSWSNTVDNLIGNAAGALGTLFILFLAAILPLYLLWGVLWLATKFFGS